MYSMRSWRWNRGNSAFASSSSSPSDFSPPSLSAGAAGGAVSARWTTAVAVGEMRGPGAADVCVVWTTDGDRPATRPGAWPAAGAWAIDPVGVAGRARVIGDGSERGVVEGVDGRASERWATGAALVALRWLVSRAAWSPGDVAAAGCVHDPPGNIDAAMPAD